MKTKANGTVLKRHSKKRTEISSGRVSLGPLKRKKGRLMSTDVVQYWDPKTSKSVFRRAEEFVSCSYRKDFKNKWICANAILRSSGVDLLVRDLNKREAIILCKVLDGR